MGHLVPNFHKFLNVPHHSFCKGASRHGTFEENKTRSFHPVQFAQEPPTHPPPPPRPMPPSQDQEHFHSLPSQLSAFTFLSSALAGGRRSGSSVELLSKCRFSFTLLLLQSQSQSESRELGEETVQSKRLQYGEAK